MQTLQTVNTERLNLLFYGSIISFFWNKIFENMHFIFLGKTSFGKTNFRYVKNSVLREFISISIYIVS